MDNYTHRLGPLIQTDHTARAKKSGMRTVNFGRQYLLSSARRESKSKNGSKGPENLIPAGGKNTNTNMGTGNG